MAPCQQLVLAPGVTFRGNNKRNWPRGHKVEDLNYRTVTCKSHGKFLQNNRSERDTGISRMEAVKLTCKDCYKDCYYCA